MITCLVTGVGGGGNGEQLVKALRLSKNNYRVIGTDLTIAAARQSNADICEELPRASDPDYVDRLLAICRKYSVDALFPGSEPELWRIAEDPAPLRAVVKLVAVNDLEVVQICSNKFATIEFLEKHRFPYPTTRLVKSAADVQTIERFPVIIKPVRGGGSQHVYVVQDSNELSLLVSYLMRNFDEVIVQEYVGRADQEYTVGVLLDGDGRLLNSIALNRSILSSLSNRIKVANRTDRADLGEVLAVSSGISQGRVAPFPEVREFCEKIALALGAKFAINVQCRLVDGKPYIFEINPRFSGTSSIRAMLGFNEPDLLIRQHILGEEVAARFPYRYGTVLRGLHEILVDDA